MKALSSLTLLCSLFSFSIFTAAQINPRDIGPTMRQQMIANETWWAVYNRYQSLNLLRKIGREVPKLSEYITDHPNERNKDYRKQIKKLAKQANSLCHLTDCEAVRGDGSFTVKNFADTDEGDIFIVQTQNHLAIHLQVKDAKTDAAYPLRVLSIKEAAHRLKERLKNKKPRTISGLRFVFLLVNIPQHSPSRSRKPAGLWR
jgi:hypothetical protein